MKLPSLNYSNEVIFSDNVPDRALNKILLSFKKNGVDAEITKLGSRNVFIKKGNAKFNIYFINSF